MSLLPGMQLDRYTILDLLGEGAMGKVYRAFDARLERAVAIKVLEPVAPGELAGEPWGEADAGEAIASALREARAAAAILHPNATAIFDADRIGDTSFIVMELVPGTSLRRFVGDPSVPVGTRIRWLVDVAGALAAAHLAGVVHRDVKPENIIVRDDGLVKVLDFGIARLPRGGTGTSSTLTSGGGLLGTPAYMAPEQIRGEEIDGRADQFGWGVLAHELLSGRLPWEVTGDPIALLAAVLSTEPAQLAPDSGVPADVAVVVRRALSKAPADRFPTMIEAAAAISSHAGARRPLRRSSPRLTLGETFGSPTLPVTKGEIFGPPTLPIPVGTEPSKTLLEDVLDRDPPSSMPSSQAAIELGFFEQVAPAASSVIPSPPSRPPPVDPVDPLMRTLASGRGPAPGPRLRPPDFSAAVDVDAHLGLLPSDATCKGIFFIELTRQGATAISPNDLFHLAGFPERRYVGFRDYPASEYLRLAVAVAMAVHSALPLGEALRRIGHTAFDTASASLVGKTLFGVFGRDLEPLLFTASRAYRVFLNFGEVSVEKAGPGVFLFTARDLPAFLETYQIGVIEGVLRHCGARGRLRVGLSALDQATVELEIL